MAPVDTNTKFSFLLDLFSSELRYQCARCSRAIARSAAVRIGALPEKKTSASKIENYHFPFFTLGVIDHKLDADVRFASLKKTA